MVETESKTENETRDFTVENNVYKGPMEIYSGNCKSIGELMWNSIISNEDKIAHLDACTDKTVTYAELQSKIVKCAMWLQQQGIKTDDVISLCTNNHLNSIVPCLAATYINAIYNPWDENMDLQTALHVMQLTTPKVIFCNEKPANIILNAIKKTNLDAKVVVFGKHPNAISFSDILNSYSDAEVANFRYVKLDNIKKTACILHSSGTTGMPKGVELSNYSLLYIASDLSIFGTDSEVILWFSSLYWISGTILNLKTIVHGSKVIIYPTFDEEMTCRLIEKYKVAVLFLSTSMINRFIRAGYVKKYSLSSLEIILGGGAILKSKAQEELKRALPHVKMHQAYGMTELGGIVTMQKSHHKSGSCGTIIKNVELKIVNPDNGKVLGPNQEGELWIKSHITVMNGYYRNPEETKNTIDEEGWLHTGDIGYIDEDGELFIIDRIKELIKYRGYQISPGEIEHVLLLHPAVLETAVVAVPHETDDEHPIAFVTKRPGFKVTEQELIDFVANNMTNQYKLRAGVKFLDTLPYTGSGKISRKELKAMAKKLTATS